MSLSSAPIPLYASATMDEALHSAVFGPCVAVHRSGDSFGEYALIRSSTRAATVVTQELCEFMVRRCRLNTSG